MLTVYRIENERGEGPFQAFRDGWEQVAGVLASYGSYDHPSPINDGIDDMEWSEVCGCISLEQLEVWFPGDCQEKLAKLGFMCKMFIVESAKVGKHQVVFKRP